MFTRPVEPDAAATQMPRAPAPKAFDEIVEAYRVLGDSKKRLEYDSEANASWLRAGWGGIYIYIYIYMYICICIYIYIERYV